MAIDWITVGAQIANFLVLVYLLKRFLYGPIVGAMERREQTIAARLDDAQSKATSAAREKQLYEVKQQELDASREALIEEARAQAREERARQLSVLRNDIASKRDEWQQELQREQEMLSKDALRSLNERVHTALERILKDLADADIEREALKKFIRRLNELPDEKLRWLVGESRSADQPVVLATAFSLTQAECTLLTRQLRETLSADIEIRFEQRPELVCGAALEVAGRRFAWSIDSYLEDLTSRVALALDGPARSMGNG
jgi:F-type H+-transporting ATPase subunit b